MKSIPFISKIIPDPYVRDDIAAFILHLYSLVIIYLLRPYRFIKVWGSFLISSIVGIIPIFKKSWKEKIDEILILGPARRLLKNTTPSAINKKLKKRRNRIMFFNNLFDIPAELR